MPSIITDPGVIIHDFPLAVVETKTTLDDANWSVAEHLYCDKLTLAVNAYDEAMLSFELGDMMQPGTAFFDEYLPFDLFGHYVRITVPQEDPLPDIVWVGFIVGTAKERSAVKETGALNRLTGKKQILRAVGLEYFLDRVQIDSAIVYDTTRIQRSIPVNGGKGVALDSDTHQRANRSPVTNADGVYAFVGSGATGSLWTAAHWVGYLLEYFTTRNTANSPFPTEFILDPQDALDGVLDGIAPTLDVDGMTTFQVLNRLLSPQRGFVWWPEFTEPFSGSHHVRIRVETLNDSLITLPSLGTIPANRDQQSLDFDKERDVEDVVLVEFGSRIYHQIICRGARMTSTTSFSVLSGDLMVDWKSEIETEYKAAAGSAADKNDAFRSDERYYRVYSAFRINPAWDGQNDIGAWVFPELSPNGSILGGLPFSIEGLRLLNTTRLKRGWDYADTANIEETTPAGTEAEYMPMFGVFHVATAPNKFQFSHAMGETNFEEGTPVSDNIRTSYHLSSQQTAPGIILRAGNGANHSAALNHWSGAAESQHEPQVDYEDFYLTCTIEADAYCEAKYPADADLPANVPLQKLVLYAGDEYRLDFLPENTLFRLDDGDLVLTNGGVLRDDRAYLQDIARVAFEWYQVERFPIKVKFRQLRNLFRLGMYISAIGSGTTQENVNTVISMIEYDFVNGTTTIHTNDQDLDLVRLA